MAASRAFLQATGGIDDDSLSATEFKARNLLLRNQRLELRLAVIRRDYPPASDVERWGAELGAAVRKVVGQIHLAAPSVVGVSVPEAEARLKEIDDEILEQFHTIGDRLDRARHEPPRYGIHRRPPLESCEDHIAVDNTSPMPGRWRADSSPWVNELMEVFADNGFSDIAVRCSAQSSKTQTVLNLACWAISEDPGPAMWVMAAKDDVKDFVRDRFSPAVNACAPVAAQIVAKERLEIVFASCPLYFVGAGSPSTLQSKPIRCLCMDEVRNYPPGALETVLKRTRAFWNSRRRERRRGPAGSFA